MKKVRKYVCIVTLVVIGVTFNILYTLIKLKRMPSEN